MSTIKLKDFNPPNFNPLRYFLLNTLTGQFEEHRAKSEDDHRYSAGFAAILDVKKNTQPDCFIALYVKDRNVCLWITNKAFKLNERTRATLERSCTIERNFRLYCDDLLLTSLRYYHNVDDGSDTDLGEWIWNVICEPYGLKRMAYIWSASAAGRKRKLPEVGLPDDLVAKIDDPFDAERDVTA